MRTLQILVSLALIWSFALPFVWAANLAADIGASYPEMLDLYKPELISGTAAMPFLFAAWRLRAWASWGLGFVAVLSPALKYALGSPSYGAEVVSALLFAAIIWRLRATESAISA